MFYVPSLGIYTPMSSPLPVPIFINRTLGYYESGVCYAFPELVFCIYFNFVCKSSYSLGEYATLDEMLLAFRRRCGFKIYMTMKPNKYGIKIFSIVDARTFFTHNLEIYVGVQPDGSFKVSNSTADVTERMCRHLSGSGRNITMDRWFSAHWTPSSQRLASDTSSHSCRNHSSQ
jgi:hypothetical protein